MEKISTTKAEIAVKQLETAIDLFIQRQDYICAITLSGAAEEVLGKLVVRTGKASAHKALSDSLLKKYNLNISEKELNDRYLNYARNSLKHLNSNGEDRTELEAQTEAISMIIRALNNLLLLDNSVTYNTPEFLKWVDQHRHDLSINP
jgi:hypothetical protein